MEKDCFIAYGAASLMHERMVTSGDGFDVAVCERCGLIGSFLKVGGKGTSGDLTNGNGISDEYDYIPDFTNK